MTIAASLAGTADAQSLRGAAEVQYQNVDRPGVTQPDETWVRSLRMDYARPLPGLLELSSHLFFTEQTLAHRPDLVRTPQGTLQLAHPWFGALASYRPVESRNASGVTSRQQELSLTGYVQKAKLPRINGSWIRSHHDPTADAPTATTVTRDVSGLYNLALTSFRIGYRDQHLEAGGARPSRTGNDNFNVGTSTQLRLGRAPISLAYDFSRARANPAGLAAQVSRLHTAGASGGLQITRRTSAGFTYNLRRTESTSSGGSPATLIVQHDGAFTLAHLLAPGVQLAGIAGLRSAAVGNQTETERYLTASASAEGDARPGWHVGTTASHSLNWLPGEKARPAESLRSFTIMRFSPDLTATGDVTLSATRSVTTAEEALPSELGLQAIAGVTSHPLRTVFLDLTAQRYRAGRSLVSGGSSSTFYTTNLRLRPSNALQMNGSLGLASSAGSRSTTVQAGFVWTPGPGLQATANYNRTGQHRTDPTVPATAGQENYSGSLVMALTRDLSGTFRYTESNPGQPSRVRILNLMLTLAFGR